MKTRTRKSLSTKLTKLLFISLIAFGCEEGTMLESPCSLDIDADLSEYQRQLDNSEIAADSPKPQACVTFEVDPDANLDINIKMRDFNDIQKEKMLKAVEKIKVVINSTEFKERVLNHTYNGQKTFVDNNNLTNKEVYQKIMGGKEDLIPEVDNEMDVDVTIYYKRSSTVGYTYPDTTRTWVNSRFFNGYTHGQVSSNVVHEWTHKIGFGHAYRSNSARPYSVPYAIGSIIEELVDSM
jgi:hypothetical protein